MNPEFPLHDVILRRVKTPRRVEFPLYDNDCCQVSQDEFTLQAEGIGSFYARNGNEVEYAPANYADPAWVKRYLHGEILAVLLHQRKIINFHASSFIHNGNGIMLLGETGAGKSSLTAAFALNGASFLSDDLTPVVIRNGESLIWPVHKTIKLSPNTIDQLRIGQEYIQKAETGTGKYFLHLKKANITDYPLHFIIKIEIGNDPDPAFYEPLPSEKFTLLRSEICSWEMLAGMPETETAYLQQLLEIVKKVKMIRIVRPQEFDVKELYRIVAEYLDVVKDCHL